MGDNVHESCAMTVAELVPHAIRVSMFAIVFALGLKASRHDVFSLFRRPGLLLRSILAMNVIMPTLAIAAALLLPLPMPIKIALVAIAASPVPPILPGKQTSAGGSASYAIGLLVAASLVAILVIFATMALVGRLVGVEYHMPLSGVIWIVLLSVIVPLVAGVIVRTLLPRMADLIARPVSMFATAILVVACLPVLFTSWTAFWELIGNGVIVILALFTAIGVAVGHWLGGPGAGDRTVLALATGTRHPGVALAIANANFPNEKAVLAVVIWHLIIGAIVSWPYIRRRKPTRVPIARTVTR